MKNSTCNIIQTQVQRQKAFFATNKTLDIKFRIQQLKKLKKSILNNQKNIEDALWKDLHKSPEESYLMEISIVVGEINYHIRNLKKWTRPKRVSTPLKLQPSRSKVIEEPLGVSLIMSPWNYPFQLLFNPLVGSISAGNCCVLKPSPEASETAKIMEKIICETFQTDYITLIQGGIETNTFLLQQHFDIIFFTGSSRVGKIVMKAAAINLTPVILELGGKSPCIVDADANLEIAAKRIIWGKLINAGQTCIAPDYLFAHESIKDLLLQKIIEQIKLIYGKEIKDNLYYPRIINQKAVRRLQEFLKQGNIVYGGDIDLEKKYIAPTIIDNINPNDLVMQEEVFGPILPVMTFEKLEETILFIKQKEKPLALYYFGEKKNAKELLLKTTSGGACINDTIMHVANHNLPFGGVGNSGLGKYHGKHSFKAFSNSRAIVTTPTFIDMPFRYAPYKYFKWIKKFI